MKQHYELDDLNQTIVNGKGMVPERVDGTKAFIKGILAACSIADDMLSSSSTHKYKIGDVVLFKLNLITKKQLRKNDKRIRSVDEK